MNFAYCRDTNKFRKKLKVPRNRFVSVWKLQGSLYRKGAKGDPKTAKSRRKHKQPQYNAEIKQNTTLVVTIVLDNVINTSGPPFHYKYNPIGLVNASRYFLGEFSSRY